MRKHLALSLFAASILIPIETQYAHATTSEGVTQDQNLVGLKKIDVSSPSSFELTSSTTTTVSMQVSISIPQGASTESNNVTYNPKDTWVTPDSTITWTNSDNTPHTVTSGSAQTGPDGKFDSGLIQPGQTFIHTFSDQGIYSYFDQVSPWLSGSVTVNVNAVPEFPLSVMLVMAVVVSMTILFTRLGSGQFYSKF